MPRTADWQQVNISLNGFRATSPGDRGNGTTLATPT